MYFSIRKFKTFSTGSIRYGILNTITCDDEADCLHNKCHIHRTDVIVIDVNHATVNVM